MPFTPDTKNVGDLIKSQDWNDAMTAIVQLFGKLHETTGHGHTGAPEDGPQIGTGGLEDAAVTLAKLANLAVSTAKLQDDSVTNDKIANDAVKENSIADGSVKTNKLDNAAVTNPKLANLSVDANKLANSAVSNSKLANLAVTGSKIANSTITQDKMASGVALEVAVSWGIFSDGQSVPAPSGFTLSECIQVAIVRRIDMGAATGFYYCYVYNGTVTISGGSASDYCNVMTFARRGGW